MNRIKTWTSKYLTLKNVFTLVIPVFIAILIIMLYNLSISVSHLSKSLISEKSHDAHSSITSRFQPISDLLKSTGSWKYDDRSELLNVNELNKKFIPILKNSDQISSMLIASTDGTEYMLLEKDGQWLNRLTGHTPSGLQSNRMLWEYNPFLEDKLIDKWTDTVRYDPRIRPWFRGALKQDAPGKIHFTTPYTFFTTGEPGITMSLYSFSEKGDTIITAFDILLRDINTISQSLKLTTNGMAFILGEDFRVIGLPSGGRFIAKDSVEHYTLKPIGDLNIPILNTAFTEWEKRERINTPFELKTEHKNWWIGFEPVVSESGQTIFWISILIPESDFLAEMNRTRVIIVAGFILVLTLTLLVIRAHNKLHRINLELAEKNFVIGQQNIDIAKKNKEITDSINYAQRIQVAILPAKEKFAELAESHFVLFMPKDIVSGDYYWVGEAGKTRLFAAVDCTGHGVPGAFVSMVGYGGLNSALKEHKLTEPDEILNHLNDTITDTFLQKTSSEVRDGMDIVICAIDTINNTLHFSGAKNPVYIIRQDASPLIIDGNENEPTLRSGNASLFAIKGDRTGIEPRTTKFSFTRKVIKTRPGDQVYLFSDGLADQFGGKENKKLTYQKFKELLLAGSHLGMDEQKEELRKYFLDWKGSNEQTDDVLVIGIRI